ncbi:AAA family ATPase [Bartonella sp. CM120XJJH]|uniref:AAA family ATPase n=1 Tax=Bartonella sp. CM120XJJH TaxID=3243544 RepID=UPI0035CF0F62
MSLPIISADERLKETKGIKWCIFGKSGIGKTSLLWTLPAEKTLFFDLEAGDLSIKGWQGDTICPRTWQVCRNIAAFIGGSNPTLRDKQPYSQAHYDAVTTKYGDAGALDRYDTIFDSITIADVCVLTGARASRRHFLTKMESLILVVPTAYMVRK